MSKQLQVLKQEVTVPKTEKVLKQQLTISQILRTYGKQFRQIVERYSDGSDGRCALGVIMSYYGWNGKDESQATKKLVNTLRCAGINKNLITEMNDSGFTFDEIADYLDRTGNSRALSRYSFIDTTLFDLPY